MIRYRLVMRGDHYRRLCEYFYPKPGFSHERFAVIFLATSKARGTRTLLPADLWLPQQSDYKQQSAHGLEISDEFVSRYYQYCADHGYSLMTLHSHPFDHGPDNFFSGTDDRSDKNQVNFFKLLVPKGYFVAGVMNQHRQLTFRVFVASDAEQHAHTFSEIRHNDIPLRKEVPGVEGSVYNTLATTVNFDRQIRVFGEEGQDRMAQMRICIVGVGGLGSVLAEILVRLGVKDFTLVDHDIAEDTNLNRFAGMYPGDVKARRPKVRIARREIKKINPRAKVRCIECEVYERRAVHALKQADLIFLCTDNATSRDFVNKFCVQQLTPCVSLGSLITFHKAQKRISTVLGEVICLIPGSTLEKCCLTCAGAINTDLLKEENAPGNLQDRLSGYVHGDQEPAPAVRYLNGLVANVAAAEFHNLVCDFKPVRAYQQINLLAQDVVSDDFLADDFDNFIQYLFCKHIIESDEKNLRDDLLRLCTRFDEREQCLKIIDPIPLADIEQLAGRHSHLIGKEKQDAFVKEITAYFSVEILSEESVITDVDIRKDNQNDCPVCGEKAYMLGEGDLAEISRFQY